MFHVHVMRWIRPGIGTRGHIHIKDVAKHVHLLWIFNKLLSRLCKSKIKNTLRETRDFRESDMTQYT